MQNNIKKEEFNPNNYPHIYFPNWFEKEHFEDFLGMELTEKQFQKIKNFLDEFVPDYISFKIKEILNESYEDIEKIINEEE